MVPATYEHLYGLEQKGITVRYYTESGDYLTAHWHPAIEIVYILNGSAHFTTDGHTHILVPGDFILIDSNQIHESYCTQVSMGICIQVTRDFLRSYIKQIDSLSLSCSRFSLTKEKTTHYIDICDKFKILAHLYVQNPFAFQLQSEAAAMDIIGEVLNYFSTPFSESQMNFRPDEQERMKEILTYIDENYQEVISLERISGHFGLSREYFCRIFKKYMGYTFTRHLNLVRLSHIYKEICSTSDPIMEIIDKNGFTNYKLFHKLFKEIYHCTAREARKRHFGSQ